ncbi:MAG: cytochrome c biogenesis protein CcsA [Planctomycetaceae bacterium]
MIDVNVFCFLASYLVAFCLEAARIARRTAPRRMLLLGFSSAGLIAHTLYLYNRSRESHLPPLLSSPHDWMLVLAWLVVTIYLFLTVSDRDLMLGIFLLPVVLVLIACAYFSSRQAHPHAAEVALKGWGMLHASLLLIGIGGVIMGLLLAAMFVFQHNRLKRRRVLGNRLRLPSLERLERWNRLSIILSVPLLTLGMMTGVILALLSERGPMISWSDPVVVASASIWLVMAVFFAWLLASGRRKGPQVARLTIWSCGFLLVTLMALQVVTSDGDWTVRTFHGAVGERSR